MTSSLPSIDLDVADRLKADPEFRHAFFHAESSARIAQQIIALRKRRGLTQAQLADAMETRQPAISRIESADYHSWSFNTLQKAAKRLDARLRVVFEAAEDVIPEYEAEEGHQEKALLAQITEHLQQINTTLDSMLRPPFLEQRGSAADRLNSPPRAYGLDRLNFGEMPKGGLVGVSQ